MGAIPIPDTPERRGFMIMEYVIEDKVKDLIDYIFSQRTDLMPVFMHRLRRAAKEIKKLIEDGDL